ncbi:MAG: hypothetical protein HY682_01950 [Chloroflexi bacterium]|nr:hypothetical protein [Chloroflexota bacterium]
MNSLARALASVTIGIAAFVGLVVFVFPWGCVEPLGVPSWERCTTFIGTPAFSFTDWDWGRDNKFDIFVPLVAGVLAGGVTLWLLGLKKAGR